jgi:nitroreductase
MQSDPVLDNIYSRRSIRSYSDEPVKDEDIKELIKAGFHAANGMNLQKLRFSVVTNKAKLREYSDTGKEQYLSFMKVSGYENAGLEATLTNKDHNIFYNAPAAIFIYAAPGILTGTEDASLAAGNIMLAAKAKGLGTCWIGLAAGLGNDGEFLKDNNIPKDIKLLAVIILGYPKDNYAAPSKRSEHEILSWIR